MLTKQLEEKLFDAVSQIDGVSLLDGAMGSCVSLFVLGKLEKTLSIKNMQRIYWKECCLNFNMLTVWSWKRE